jgi:hypothetical protein
LARKFAPGAKKEKAIDGNGPGAHPAPAAE